MRIVHITEAFGGGVLSMLTELCNRAAATGAQVTVLYSTRPETPQNFLELFHPSVDLVFVAMCRDVRVRQDWQSMWALVKQLRLRSPTVIHLHSSKAGVLGRAAAKIATQDAKVFYSPHGLSFLRRDVSRAKQLAYLSFERMAHLLGGTTIACSPSELQEIEKNIRAKGAKMIENGVDVDSIPTRETRNDDDVRIGMIGRASFQKHHELFFALADRLYDSKTRFHWIGGKADELPGRDQSAAITCSGWLTRSRALELMSGLDIYVQTSRYEGMPIALIEAQVAGIPAVVTDVVGNRDVVVHGVTGFVASTEDELAGFLIKLRADPQLRKRMGSAARELATVKFSMDTIFYKWLNAYEASADRQVKDVIESYSIGPCDVQPSADKPV